MSLVYTSRQGFMPLVALAIGGSLALHVLGPTTLAHHFAPPEQAEPQQEDLGIRGAIMFDLSDVIAAPNETAENSVAVTESVAAPTITDSPEVVDPAKARETPILQQTPYDVEDDSLKFAVAAPETEAETELDATRLAEEFVEEQIEKPTSAGADDREETLASQAGVASDQTADQVQAESEGITAAQIAEITEWQKSIVLRIAHAKTYPSEARVNGIEGEVRVAFAMDRYGEIISRRIETSSGYAILDAAALRVFDEIGKMPTPPNHLSGERFEMLIPFSFAFKR